MQTQATASTINGRLYWGKRATQVKKLDLTKLQRDSYEKFLNESIGTLLQEITPVTDFTGKNWKLEFGEYFFGKPKLMPEQCTLKGVSYDAPLRVKVTLTNLQTEKQYKH